jgi:periplasmic divalent cation tolerance protein
MIEEFEFVVVRTTVDSEDTAQELARSLVEERLAACVHCTKIESTYRWKGTVESEQEYALTAKTRASLVGEVIDFIKNCHSYEVPEILVTPIIAGFKGYLDWVKEETRSATSNAN